MAASSSTGASISSSTAVHSNRIQCCDVFINHRGVDVKTTFARSLYLRLIQNGLRAFLDKEEMQPGYNFSYQIEQAIETASVHVAIFSPRYAESNWCLDELQMMLKSKAPIIPVFYRVTPAEVRWTTGKYAQDLRNLAEKKNEKKQLRYASETIEDWKNALSQVADNSGFELETCNGEELEPKLLDKVVECVLKMVKKPDLHVTEHPTGLDHKLKDFEDTVMLHQQPQSGKPQILGIVGFGGIGKTTLAKHFFNKKKLNYSRSCFLFEVKEKAAKGSLNLLQSQLLNSLNRLDVQVNNQSLNALHDLDVDEGKGMLIKPLKSLNALIVLDDVDDVDQVTALLPLQLHELCSGSLILITSRNERILTSSRVEKSSIYRLTGLSIEHSKELFCTYAFGQAFPFPGYECVADKFLESCNGLPLSLKVLGAHLYTRDICDWDEELGSLPIKLKDFLKISYDALNAEEQQIFLDIACFFRIPRLYTGKDMDTGIDRDTGISLWNASGWKGRLGFQNLHDKCLIEVDTLNMIHMHEQLRELGKDIAQKSPPLRLHGRGTKGVIDYLSQQSSVVAVRGITTMLGDTDYYNIRNMELVLPGIHTRSLQILETRGDVGELILRRAESPNILFLAWYQCPFPSLPSWIPLNNLRHLNVIGSELITLWNVPVLLEELWAVGCVKLKRIQYLARCTKLRMLYVDRCFMLEELPRMKTLVSLEELSAIQCVKLKSIDQGLAYCTKLKLLNVDGCSALEKVPSMETLISLELFRATGCVKLKSILGMNGCTRLSIICLDQCSSLEELPSMETLVSLEQFSSCECVKLKRIEGLGHCTKLRLLSVDGCSELEELPSMETLVSLEGLTAMGCVKLKRIEGLAHCTKVKVLNVEGCSELEELPSMETLVSLDSFGAKGCLKLKSILGMNGCTRLSLIYLDQCSALEELPSMETLVSLEYFTLCECVKLKRIEGLGHCTKLRLLCVNGCSELEELPSMETLVSLEGLTAMGCVKLKRIEGLAHCTKVKVLNVDGCFELEELPSMETLVSLDKFSAQGCLKLKSILGMNGCTRLSLIYLDRCSALEELPSMETLVSLEQFSSCERVKLKRIEGLGHCTKLMLLRVNGCSELEELPSMETLVSLEHFSSRECVKLKRIEGLGHCTKLKLLRVNGCSELEELPSMETLVSLEEFGAKGCLKLKRIEGLGHCTKLRLLRVDGCSELEELPSMETLVSLKVFRATGCVKLKSILGMNGCTRLSIIYLDQCSALEELPSMETLVSLEEFDAKGCMKLKNILGMNECTVRRLKCLSVDGAWLQLLNGVTWLRLQDMPEDEKHTRSESSTRLHYKYLDGRVRLVLMGAGVEVEDLDERLNRLEETRKVNLNTTQLIDRVQEENGKPNISILSWIILFLIIYISIINFI